MKLIFVDEVYGSKDKKFFGLGILIIDSSKYRKLCELFAKTLKKHNWPASTEIKGKYCFSDNPANTGKRPAEMVALASELISGLVSSKFSRGEFYFVHGRKEYSIEFYCTLLRSGIKKMKAAQSRENAKHLTNIYLDDFSGLHKNLGMLSEQLSAALRERDYELVENTATIVLSSNGTPGIVYADVLAYLARWIAENPGVDAVSNEDVGITRDNATSARKIVIAHEILSTIRKKMITIE